MPTQSKNLHRCADGRYEVRFRFGSTDRRRFFHSRAAAVEYIEDAQAKILSYGQLGLELKANQYTRVMGALEALAPGNPTKGVQILEELVYSHLRRPAESGEAVTIAQVAASLFEDWGRTPGNRNYRRNAGAIIRRFIAEFGSKLVTELTPADVRTWVLTQSQGNRLTSKARISVLFSHAISRRWLGEHRNPCGEFSLPKVAREPVVVPDPEDLCRYLALAATKYPSLLPYLAVRLFAGLRASEARKIQWSDFDLERGLVKVRQGVVAAKNGRGRSIPIAGNLLLWLQKFGRRRGAVAPINVGELEAYLNAEFRKLEGFETGTPLAKKWHNALRHSYASYRVGQVGDNLETLSTELGNSPDIAIGHYIGAVTLENEVAFWRIIPRGDDLIAVIEVSHNQSTNQDALRSTHGSAPEVGA